MNVLGLCGYAACVSQVRIHLAVDGITEKPPLQRLVPGEPIWAQTGISFKGLLGLTVFVFWRCSCKGGRKRLAR